MKRCRTCHFFNPGNDEYGICTHQKLREKDQYTDAVTFGNGDDLVCTYYDDGYFEVGERFGCIHYEEKE